MKGTITLNPYMTNDMWELWRYETLERKESIEFKNKLFKFLDENIKDDNILYYRLNDFIKQYEYMKRLLNE